MTDSRNSGLSHLAERRMSEWEKLKHETENHAHLTESGGQINYITISRQVGSGGSEVAKILAELMNWQLYDKAILNYMAENMQVHTSVLQSVDERTSGWVAETLGSFFTDKRSRHVDHLSYYKHLMEVLLVIAKHGRAIIVGRGAGHLLPRDRGLSVRVIAPFELRVKRSAEVRGISIKEATALVKKADKEQQQFMKSLFYKEAFESEYYDIEFNTEKLTPTAVAKLIWRAFDQRIQSRHEKEKAKEETI